MTGDGGDTQRVYVFEVEDTYLFKQYFTLNEIFDELREYYNGEEYRFEVPVEDFSAVADVLESYAYEPVFVEDFEEFCVVKEEYTAHAEILRNAVLNWSRDGYNFFVMKNLRAVDEAVEQGATRIDETEFVVGI